MAVIEKLLQKYIQPSKLAKNLPKDVLGLLDYVGKILSNLSG
jgi:hypothetical protein